MESILGTVKSFLGVPAELVVFDGTLTMLINSAFADLHSIGVGPRTPYSITGQDNLWSEFYTDSRLNSVQDYVCVKTRLGFDNSTMTSYTIKALQDLNDEHVHRLQWAQEEIDAE